MIQLHYHFQDCNVEKTHETWFSAFCIFTGHLSETAEQPFYTPVETTVWIYHGIWDNRLALPTALSKLQHSVWWVRGLTHLPDPSPCLHPLTSILHYYICACKQHSMHNIMGKEPFCQADLGHAKTSVYFSAMDILQLEHPECSGEEGQGSGEGTALQCLSTITAQAQKHPSCPLGIKA